MKTVTRITTLVIILALIGGVAYARFAKPQEAIQYRKAVMVLIGQHFKRMGAVIKGQAAYDQAAFTADAQLVASLARLPWEAAREPGTDKGDTTMRAAVFKQPEDFKAAAQSFEAATVQLAQAAAEGGGVGVLKAPFGSVAQSCKACHKAFRK
jgi:cytochrome c556